jgi:HSP20 family protein
MTLPVLVHRDNTSPAPSGVLAEVRRLDDCRHPWAQTFAAFEHAPRTELRDTDDAYVIEFNLPGARKRDLDVSLAGRRLRVFGAHKDRCGMFRRRTRRVERFCSDILLPGDVDQAGVCANLDNGVLTVTVPKAANERRRRIQAR